MAGYAAFRVDLAAHPLLPTPGLASVRQWWESTVWIRHSSEEYLEASSRCPTIPRAQQCDPDGGAVPWDPL